jgi:plastocyanin
MTPRNLSQLLLFALAMAPALQCAQAHPAEKTSVELRLSVNSSLPGSHRAVPAVAWLTPMQGTSLPPFVPQAHYTLSQKNRMFTPHLQVIPVGGVVQFPNADPFFHNVFSLFEGKRFDLGLYEAGSSKSVTFGREGVSYIFCNIHPEMSAVVLTLSTPLYATADANDSFVLRRIPPGEYKLHVWIEGVPQSFLDGLSRAVHIGSHDLDLGTFSAPIAKPREMAHKNKFGNPYDTNPQAPY